MKLQLEEIELQLCKIKLIKVNKNFCCIVLVSFFNYFDQSAPADYDFWLQYKRLLTLCTIEVIRID